MVRESLFTDSIGDRITRARLLPDRKQVLLEQPSWGKPLFSPFLFMRQIGQLNGCRRYCIEAAIGLSPFM